MGPVDPPIRVGTTISPPSPASPTLALDRRISPGSLAVGQELNARLLSDRTGGRFLALIDGRAVEVVLPPGAKGTMRRMGRLGRQAGWANSGNGRSPAASPAIIASRRVVTRFPSGSRPSAPRACCRSRCHRNT